VPSRSRPRSCLIAMKVNTHRRAATAAATRTATVAVAAMAAVNVGYSHIWSVCSNDEFT
jgi:hypothetical protein